MTVTATVLFGTPQSEIATLLSDMLSRSVSTSIVTGFATVEGIRAIETSLDSNPAAVQTIVVGAATFQSFEALDRLVTQGISRDRLFVHLGHSHLTGPDAKHRFYRYHPMLHSKVYYAEQADGTASAIVGSHNITGFALNGRNGEAAVLLTGPRDSAEFEKTREHIRIAREQAVSYSQDLKEAYAWWAHQFLEGLSDKANDFPREGEAKKTIVIIAELAANIPPPKKNDVVYFELPSALGKVQSLQAEVHIYLFDQLPPSPSDALDALHTARASVWCVARGIELEKGGVELKANWRIADHNRPTLQRVVPPRLRPNPANDMQQVRVKAFNQVRGEFEYLFKAPPRGWIPILESHDTIGSRPTIFEAESEYFGPNPENVEWYRVVGLAKDESSSKFGEALVRMSPEAGSYVLMSMRRREKIEKSDDSKYDE
jgi:hypothetical protein